LGVAIGAEKAEIDKPIIVIDTVNVVQMQRERSPSPFNDPAFRTDVAPAIPKQPLD
jgi:hypothetical protein